MLTSSLIESLLARRRSRPVRHDPMRGGPLAYRILSMNRASYRFLLLLFSVTLWGLGVPQGFGQSPQSPEEPPPAEFEDQVSVGYVLVPVVVRSGAGYARNLDQEDFRLLVDGRQVGIESFERRAEAPASLVFLQ